MLLFPLVWGIEQGADKNPEKLALMESLSILGSSLEGQKCTSLGPLRKH